MAPPYWKVFKFIHVFHRGTQQFPLRWTRDPICQVLWNANAEMFPWNFCDVLYVFEKPPHKNVQTFEWCLGVYSSSVFIPRFLFIAILQFGFAQFEAWSNCSCFWSQIRRFPNRRTLPPHPNPHSPHDILCLENEKAPKCKLPVGPDRPGRVRWGCELRVSGCQWGNLVWPGTSLALVIGEHKVKKCAIRQKM